MLKQIAVVIVLLTSTKAFAAGECAQPVTIINIGNLACADPKTGKIIHNTYQGSYKLDIFSDDEKNDWYRGDFYGMDDD